MSRAAFEHIKVLVLSDGAADAEVVEAILAREFSAIRAVTDRRNAAREFDEFLPDVVVFVARPLEALEAYHAELRQTSPRFAAHHRHRTIVVCAKEELQRAYDLCRAGTFDDYVIFWPVTHDHLRLMMSVVRAARELSHMRSEPAAEQEATAGGAAWTGRDAKQPSGALRMLAHQCAAALEAFASELEGAGSRVSTANSQKFDSALPQAQARLLAAHALRGARPVQGPVGVAVETSEKPRATPAILIVEDEPTQQKILSGILGGASYAVTVASSAADGLRVACEQRFDLILLDYMLPDANGLDVLRGLRARTETASVPVIMVTGSSQKEIVVESQVAGAADFIVKPFSAESILTKVAGAFRLAEA